jgi:hypothetical protein
MIWPSTSDERGVRSAVTLLGKRLEIALAFLSLLDPADKIIFMESEHDLLGEYAYLPDDQLVVVEVMYSMALPVSDPWTVSEKERIAFM